MITTRGIVPMSPNDLGRAGGGGGGRGGGGGGGRGGGGGGRHGSAMAIHAGGGGRGGGWRWNPSVNRYIFVGSWGWGGGWGWPGWGYEYPYYGYPYGGYPGYGYPGYGYPAVQQQAQPVQQAQAPTPCPTNVRLSEADMAAVSKGQSIRLTGANQCGQAVDVTVQRTGASAVSGLGLDGEFLQEPPMDGYGFTPFGAEAPPSAFAPEAPPVMGGEYDPPPDGYGDPQRGW